MYLFASSGIAMDVHFCMGKELGVNFYQAASSKCSKCGMAEKKDGCCRDEHSFHKLNSDHQNPAVSHITTILFADISHADFNFEQFIPFSDTPLIAITGPPDIPKAGIGLLNSVSRI